MKPFKKVIKCHVDGQEILKIGSASIHASSNAHEYDGYALIINVSNYSYSDRSIASGMRGANKMMQHFLAALPQSKQIEPPEITITWPDGGIPDLLRSDWMRMLHDLSKIDGKVLVHCMGGHGRTGTALAILLGLSKAVTKDPVKWLRTHYCEKVVESKQQFDYLKKLGIHTSCQVEVRPYIVHPHNMGNEQWFSGSNWKQEEYDLTKPEYKSPQIDGDKSLTATYKCVLCCRSLNSASFYQTFMDGTGFCWSCHHQAHKPISDIQSA